MSIYNRLYMLPHTVVMVCTLQVSLVQLLVEVLFLLVLELDLLIYMEFDGIGCSFLVLLFTFFDLDADVLGL